MGSSLVCISSAWGVGLVYLVGLPVGIWWFYIGLIPLSYVYRGGAVRLLFSLVASALYYSYLFVGLCPFGNKFLIIQKKKKKFQAANLIMGAGYLITIPMLGSTVLFLQYLEFALGQM